VTACVRNPDWVKRYYPDVHTITADFTRDHDTETWLSRLHSIDAVVNCIGIIKEHSKQTFEYLHTKAPCALFKACDIAKVRKVIQISALGADDTASSEYHLSKKAADECLSQRALDWTILMPSIVYGHGAKSMAFFKALAALPLTPLVDTGNQPIQPVHIDDLCHAVIKALHTNQLSHKRIDVVGPAPVTMRALYTTLKTWLGMKHAIFISLPYGASLFAARVAGFMGNTPLTYETVQMLKKGNTGNVASYIEATGITPRPFEQTIMKTPPLPGDIHYAKHFFLIPLLRITLAVLWIVTGYISAFVYPIELSFSMLAKVGIGQTLAPLALYSAAALDVILGFTLLINYRVRLVALVQIILMVSYSILITIGLPDLWIHPFGPVTKNIPLIVATLLILSVTRK